ncbi:hypothetical protein [Nostoc sp.]
MTSPTTERSTGSVGDLRSKVNQFIRANSERSLIRVMNVVNPVLELIGQLTGK